MRSLCSLLATCTFVLTYPSTAAMAADDNCREFTSMANISGQEPGTALNLPRTALFGFVRLRTRQLRLAQGRGGDP